jgi:RecA/RadA recombinase
MAKTKLSTTTEKSHPFGKIFKVLKDDPDIRVGFADIDLWADTGIYALNRRLSNRYDHGFLFGRSVGIYGEPGSGKSLLLAQTCGLSQKKINAFIVWVDVEAAVSDRKQGLEWFQQAGIDTENNFERLFAPTFRKALKIMTQFVNMYREDEETKELPPLIVVFDSYSALQTDTMIEQNKGKKDLTQDMGQKARQLGDFVSRANSMVEGLRVLVTGVMHVYMSQEEYGARHKITGGLKALFTASQSIKVTKFDLTNEKASPHLRLSADADDKRNNIGIRSVCEIIKSRYSKPFEKIDLEIVYPAGIDRYSGLFELFLEDGTITSPSNAWYQFIRPDGEVKKFQKKDFLKYADELMTFPVPERKLRSDADEPFAFDTDEDAAPVDLELEDPELDEQNG